MKTRILTLIVLTAIALNIGCNNSTKKEELNGTITISGAFALYPLVVKWAEEFQKQNPGVRIDVSAGGAGKGMTDALSGMVTLGMVSREISKEEIDKGAWFIPVTKDAVVPVISSENPHLQKFMNNGVKKEIFQGCFLTGKVKTWGDFVNDSKIKDEVKVFTRSDACGAADVWAKFLGKKQEDLQGVGVSGDPGITQAVKADKLGIGYNNIGYAYDAKTKLELPGIKVIPIDFNGNGQIDDKEFFYQNKDSLVKAINDGRFPSPPARDLYLVAKGKPTDKATLAFLNWILTEGQKMVGEAGYINLKPEKIKTALETIK
ncbi:MAG: extracellular solute-binding protein [Bacteroidetes bacterium]|nr:extracellular solute-binding protein [Bacteroidota bacterium]